MRERLAQKLAELADGMPAEKGTGFKVLIAGVARYDFALEAWELISGTTSTRTDAEALRARILDLMLEQEPGNAMSSLLRNRPTSAGELEKGMKQWLAADPKAARTWYDECSPMLMGEQADKLAALMGE